MVERAVRKLIGSYLFDEVSENEADDWGHDLADVCAGLFALELGVLEEEGLELGVLFLGVGSV